MLLNHVDDALFFTAGSQLNICAYAALRKQVLVSHFAAGTRTNAI
jgi:hypothetical protein